MYWGYDTWKNRKTHCSNTLAARGLEEQRNFEELLTESVGHLHFSDLLCLFWNIKIKVVGPLIFSAKVNHGWAG
jgi:hypothetical protein